ncbi:hypothetical protein M0R45_009230 [Rubus argutus]|uniref:Uncharacterized protein n=1 Tax=Rubus argutus TaxID=59490 RepID=A0AAW1Y3Y4_RUBAR
MAAITQAHNHHSQQTTIKSSTVSFVAHHQSQPLLTNSAASQSAAGVVSTSRAHAHIPSPQLNSSTFCIRAHLYHNHPITSSADHNSTMVVALFNTIVLLCNSIVSHGQQFKHNGPRLAAIHNSHNHGNFSQCRHCSLGSTGSFTKQSSVVSFAITSPSPSKQHLQSNQLWQLKISRRA